MRTDTAQRWLTHSLVGVLLLTAANALQTRAAASADPVGTCRPDPAGPPVARARFAASTRSAYILPFERGVVSLVWRTTSHFAKGNGGVGVFAIDFELPIGTPVVAVRGGTIVAVRDTFVDGNDRDLEENYVMVRHADSTVARYIHLTKGGALVALGDVVRRGQRIALSGNTGQTGGPHLHFDVQRCGPNLPPAYNVLPCGMTVPLTFRGAGAHPCGLVPGRRYARTD